MVFLGSECCSFQQSCANENAGMPCLMFWLQDLSDIQLENTSQFLADLIFPILLETIIKGIIHCGCLLFCYLCFKVFMTSSMYLYVNKLVVVRLRCMQPAFYF